MGITAADCRLFGSQQGHIERFHGHRLRLDRIGAGSDDAALLAAGHRGQADLLPHRGQGKVADYIPALARIDPNKLGFALALPDGAEFAAAILAGLLILVVGFVERAVLGSGSAEMASGDGAETGALSAGLMDTV